MRRGGVQARLPGLLCPRGEPESRRGPRDRAHHLADGCRPLRPHVSKHEALCEDRRALSAGAGRHTTARRRRRAAAREHKARVRAPRGRAWRSGQSTPIPNQYPAGHLVRRLSAKRLGRRKGPNHMDYRSRRPGGPIPEHDRCDGGRRCRAEPAGCLRGQQHTLIDRPLPDVRREPPPARGCLATLLRPVRQRRGPRQCAGDPRHTGPAYRTRRPARLRFARPLAFGRFDGRHA